MQARVNSKKKSEKLENGVDILWTKKKIIIKRFKILSSMSVFATDAEICFNFFLDIVKLIDVMES